MYGCVADIEIASTPSRIVSNGRAVDFYFWGNNGELRCDKMLQNGADVHSARIFLLSLRCLLQQMFHSRIDGKRVVGFQFEWFAGEECTNSFDPVLLDLSELLRCWT